MTESNFQRPASFATQPDLMLHAKRRAVQGDAVSRYLLALIEQQARDIQDLATGRAEPHPVRRVVYPLHGGSMTLLHWLAPKASHWHQRRLGRLRCTSCGEILGQALRGRR